MFLTSLDLIFVAVFMLITLLLMFVFIPVGLWYKAMVSGVPISLLELILLRFKKIPPRLIVDCLIISKTNDLGLASDSIQAAFLAGLDITKITEAMAKAKQMGKNLSFQEATEFYLKGADYRKL